MRGRIPNLISWLQSGTTSDLLKLTDHYLNHVNNFGGYFYLWGHSLDIDRYNLWQKLEHIMQHLSERKDYIFSENGNLKDN